MIMNAERVCVWCLEEMAKGDHAGSGDKYKYYKEV